MGCGKSALALQIDHNQRARDRQGLMFTKLDRAGESVLSSRLGLETTAVDLDACPVPPRDGPPRD